MRREVTAHVHVLTYYTYQLILRDHGYGPSASRGVPV